jgi:dTDP-4-dehydrorhamnose 3,5-epimerase
MSDCFDILDTPLAGLRILQRKPLHDARGYLERLYCTQALGGLLAGRTIVQINRTLTVRRGTVRGMHYQQPPHAETKFVSCLRGEVFDVAVDLRRDSPTFLHWYAETLSESNHRTLFIPEGFAHGFQTLTENCEMLYFHTAAYAPDAERGLNPRDPGLTLSWPLPIADISERDAAQASLAAGFRGLST